MLGLEKMDWIVITMVAVMAIAVLRVMVMVMAMVALMALLIADADTDVQSRNLTSTPMAKLMLRLEKGIRMVISGFVAAQGWPPWILGFFTRATTLRIVRLYSVENMNCRI